MLIKGCELSEYTKRQVLNAYGYRWTNENYQRAVKWYDNLGMPRIELQTDEQWLNDHAFYVTKRGDLDRRYRYCEPAYIAD